MMHANFLVAFSAIVAWSFISVNCCCNGHRDSRNCRGHDQHYYCCRVHKPGPRTRLVLLMAPNLHDDWHGFAAVIGCGILRFQSGPLRKNFCHSLLHFHSELSVMQLNSKFPDRPSRRVVHGVIQMTALACLILGFLTVGDDCGISLILALASELRRLGLDMSTPTLHK